MKLGSCPSFPQLEIQLPAFLLCRELLGGLSVLLSVGCLETDVLGRAGVQARKVVPPWVPSAGERWEVLIPAWSCLLSEGMWVEFSAHELSLPFSHILYIRMTSRGVGKAAWLCMGELRGHPLGKL